MRKHFRILLTAMLILTLAMCAFAPSVFAQNTSVGLTLRGNIQLTDHPESFSENYTLVLKAADSSNAMPEGSTNGTFEYSVAAGEFALPEISFNELGIYEYTLSQKAGSADRWTYDSSIYYITVYVTNSESGDGYEVAAAAYKNSESLKSDIEFTNTYAPAPVAVTITAQKTLQEGKLSAGQFSFQLKDESGNVAATATNDANGAIRFEDITFDAVGTYVYQLSEVAGTEKDIVYDSTVYTITFTVVQDGDLVASAAYAKNGTPVNIQEPEFVNEQIVKPGDTANITLWVALFAIAAVAVVALVVIGKKRK